MQVYRYFKNQTRVSIYSARCLCSLANHGVATKSKCTTAKACLRLLRCRTAFWQYLYLPSGRPIAFSRRVSSYNEDDGTNTDEEMRKMLSKGSLYHMARVACDSESSRNALEFADRLLNIVSEIELNDIQKENITRCLNAVLHSLDPNTHDADIDSLYSRMRGNSVVLIDEATFSLYLKHKSTIGQWEFALRQVDDLKNIGLEPHARTYSPLVISAMKSNAVSDAFEIFKSMIRLEKEIDHDFYAEFIQLIGHLKGPNRMKYAQDIFMHLRNQFVSLEPQSAHAVEEFFWHGTAYDVGFTSLSRSGKCHFCGSTLEAITLDEGQTKKLCKQILTFCERTVSQKLQDQPSPKRQDHHNQFLDSISGISNKDDNLPKSLAHLKHYLDLSGPFDVMLDVLNIGYHAHRGFNTVQVANVIKHFRERNKTILLLCAGPLSSGLLTRKLRNREDEHLAKFLRMAKQRCGVYFVGSSQVDDYFMLYAIAHHKMNITLVTSDRLRDHSCNFDGDVRRDFKRWQRSHQIEVRSFQQDGTPVMRQPKKNDIIVQHNEGTWHFPVDEGRAWLCAHKKRKPIKTTKAEPKKKH